jgi:hypothetical protein
VRVLPNKTKSNGSSQRVRRGPHAKTYLVWQVLVASLILDPLIPLFTFPRIPLDLATTMATCCAIGILPFLAQERLHRILSKLRLLHSKRLDVGSQTIPISLAVSAGIVILLKIFMFAQLPAVALVVLALVVLWGSRKYLSQVRAQTAQDKELFALNPWAQVERWEDQVLVFAVLPLFLARAIGVCADLADIAPDAGATRSLFIAVSALFLAMLRPDRSLFIGLCKSCKRPVPVVFQDIGSCLSCDERLRIAYHAWANRIPIEQLLRPPAPTDSAHPSSRSDKERTTAKR